MIARITGEVRQLRANPRNEKYVDVAVLPEGSVNGTRMWAYADAEGLDGVDIGATVEAEVYVQAKTSERGPYLSTQLRKVKVLTAA